MDKCVKEEIAVILDLLKKSLIKNHVSIATDDKGNIYFFDTNTYIKEQKMNGFQINIKDLAK